MSISVIEPIAPSINRTKLVLFQPFDFPKWLKLGLCAFLASLTDGGGSGSGGGGGDGAGGGADLDGFVDFLREYAVIIAAVVIALIVLGLVVAIVLEWLSSRGKFMFLDGVVRNRGAIVEPWNEYRSEGNSLFVFSFLLGICGLLLILLVLGIAAAIAWPDIRAGQFGVPAGTAIAVAGLGVLVVVLAMIVIGTFLKDFVVPIMYHCRVPVLEGWQIFRDDILVGNAGVLTAYLLFKVVIGVVVGVLAVMVVCLTCCIAAIPYVSSVVFLPLSVFMRCYSLYFLAQFGPKWQIIPPGDKPPKPGPGY